MTVEIRPFGTRCNIQCRYCYQEPRREAGLLAKSFDIEKIKEAVLAEGDSFSLFGGEPLLVRLTDLEELWSWGYQRFGRNTIQTNGTLIRDDHIELFKRYNVSVGISIDGPGELNDVRWAGRLEATRGMTAKTEIAIERLCREKIRTSIIITLHRGNAVGERLDRLVEWVRGLDALGLIAFRLHLLESENDGIRNEYGLTTEENVAALTKFYALEKTLKTTGLDIFNDMRRLLMGDDRQATCIWKGCDPYTTRAVRGVEGNGQRSNCGRTNKEGIEFVKSDTEGFERTLALYHTPQEVGGCQGCQYFLMCRGNCPGTAMDGDWRNRTEHCGVWKASFAVIEEELMAKGKQPLSRSKDRDAVEAAMVAQWQIGRNPPLKEIIDGLVTVDESYDWRAEFSRLRHETIAAVAASRKAASDGSPGLSAP